MPTSVLLLLLICMIQLCTGYYNYGIADSGQGKTNFILCYL